MKETELSSLRRHGASQHNILTMQSNLANTYASLGRPETLRMKRDVYTGRLKLQGEENRLTLIAALNYAASFVSLDRFEEAKALMRKTIPVVRRIFGEGDDLTLRMRWMCAVALYKSTGATVDDLGEAATTLGEIERTARRVLGGAHPTTKVIELALGEVRKRIQN